MIKVLQKICLLITIFVIFDQKAIHPTLQSVSTFHPTNFEFVKNCCKQAQKLRSDLLAILHDLSQDLDYWKLQKLTTLSYFISKGPIGWFSGKTQQEELNEKINYLKKAIDFNAYYLGSIQGYLGKNYKEMNSHEIEQSMKELLILIHQCVTNQLTTNSFNQDPKSQCAELLLSNKENLLKFKKRMQTAYYGYKKPNHFRRNWLAYSAATIGAVSLAVYAYNNQEQIKQWYATANTALNNYWQTHVVDPIVNSADILTVEHDPLVTEESVKLEEKILGELIQKKRDKEHNRKRTWKQWASDLIFARSDPLSKREPYSQPEINKEKELAIKKGDLTRTYEDIIIQAQTPLPNIPHGSLPGDVLIIGQNEKVKLARVELLLSKVIKSSRLIIELLALYPTVILGKMIYSTGKSTIDYLNKKNTISLKKHMRLLHRTLNKYSRSEDISLTDQGLLVFWIYELKKQLQDISLDDRTTFIEDLNDLLRLDLPIKQKKAIMQHMYGTYSFLAPKA